MGWTGLLHPPGWVKDVLYILGGVLALGLVFSFPFLLAALIFWGVNG